MWRSSRALLRQAGRTRPADKRCLLLDQRTVALADFAPSAVQIATRAAATRERSLLRGCFVYFDAPTRSFVRVEVTVLHDRAPLEDFLCALVERAVLLDAEVVANHVQRDIGR